MSNVGTRHSWGHGWLWKRSHCNVQLTTRTRKSGKYWCIAFKNGEMWWRFFEIGEICEHEFYRSIVKCWKGHWISFPYHFVSINFDISTIYMRCLLPVITLSVEYPIAYWYWHWYLQLTSGFHKILKKHDRHLPNPCKAFYTARLHDQAWASIHNISNNLFINLFDLLTLYDHLPYDLITTRSEEIIRTLWLRWVAYMKWYEGTSK